ncbi:hypothetical protein BSF42_42780 [Flavobacterium sp. ACN6]|nr:hypothetical protein BSF42_42780 [Flavobacterium sp. ACN6]
MTLAVTITPETIPNFATSLTLCSIDTAPALAATSPNGITGSWSPALISTAANGSYIFTPDAGQCASAVTLAVTITPETVPNFAATLNLCSTDTAPALAATSPNGISGTWNPALVSNTDNIYVFTPNPGQCATIATLAVIISSDVIPDFATTLNLCKTDTAPVLATTSPNGITGNWNPAVISTANSGNYIFTPTTGQCAEKINLLVTIRSAITPDFMTTVTLCKEDTVPLLDNTSPNGILGTWNPAVINESTSGNYIFTPNVGQCATTASVTVNVLSPTYSITQEFINNKYLLKVILNSNFPWSDYTIKWINEKGVQVGYNTPIFDFTEYVENLNYKPILPLQFKLIIGYGSCEIEETFAITNNFCRIPNAISPNDDGVNDNFDISCLNVKDLTILNRYGREVYQFTGKYENQWHGQWKDGKLPMGTYFYIISAENGERRAGWVYLTY